MKKIIFRKIFPYDPTNGGKYSRYRGYHLIGMQQFDTGLSGRVGIEIPKRISQPIYSSTLLRAKETGKIISQETKIMLKTTEDLKEIKFSLKKLLSRREFDLYGSNLVRERFIDSFIKNRLEEKRSKVKQRIDSILLTISNFKDGGSYLFVSHSFIMKILQTYLQDNRLFDKPEILKKYFNPNFKTFDFGKGFEFNVK